MPRALRLTALTVLLLTPLCPAQAVELNSLPQWVRAWLAPVEVFRATGPQPAEGLAPLDPVLLFPPLEALLPARPVGTRGAAVSPAGLGGLSVLTPGATGRPVAPGAVSATAAGLGALPDPVRVGGGVRGALPATVTAGSAAPATASLGRLGAVSPGAAPRHAPLQTSVAMLALKWSDAYRRGEFTIDSFGEWAKKEGIPYDTLVAALDTVSAFPLDPVYAPVCSAIDAANGGEVSECVRFPARARLLMAVHCGMNDREANAKEILSAITPKEQTTSLALYIAAEHFFLARRSPQTTIWALKRGAAMSGRADEAARWCWPISVVCCHRLYDGELTRRELLPYAERALASAGSEPRWNAALPALVEGYVFVGEPLVAVERGRHWLSQAGDRGAATSETVARARLMLGRALVAAGRPGAAREELRGVCLATGATAAVAEAAQEELLKLAAGGEGHAATGQSRLPRAGQSVLRLRLGDQDLAIASGAQWFDQEFALHPADSGVLASGLGLAEALAARGRGHDAARALRSILQSAPEVSWIRQATLRQLSELPAAVAGDLPAPHVTRVSPPSLRLTASTERQSVSVAVRGNATLLVSQPVCSIPGSAVRAPEAELGSSGLLYTVAITLGGAELRTAQHGTIGLSINDPDRPALSVPVTVMPRDPLRCVPPRLFLGGLASSSPRFTVGLIRGLGDDTSVNVQVDRPELLSASCAKQGPGTVLLSLSLSKTAELGPIEGRVSVNCSDGRQLQVPYYAHSSVSDR